MVDNQRHALHTEEAKPRLKWTRQLHERFVEVVSRLGGVEKATPKAVMQMMSVPGLTLYHFKSHLQKYRNAVSRKPETCCTSTRVAGSLPSLGVHWFKGDSMGAKCVAFGEDRSARINECGELAAIEESMWVQMEVQKILHEQFEVQRHLQLRIEAQGRYLQSVLRKAQETLAGYNLDSDATDVKEELSKMVSVINYEGLSPCDCFNSCISSVEWPRASAGGLRKHTSAYDPWRNFGDRSNELEESPEAGFDLKHIEHLTIDRPVRGECSSSSSTNVADHEQHRVVGQYSDCSEILTQTDENRGGLTEEIDLNTKLEQMDEDSSSAVGES